MLCTGRRQLQLDYGAIYSQPNNVILRVAPHEHVASSPCGLAARLGA